MKEAGLDPSHVDCGVSIFLWSEDLRTLLVRGFALPCPQAPVGEVAGGPCSVRGPSGSSMGCGLLASPICHPVAWQALAFVPPYFYDKLKAELPGTRASWLN